MALLQNDKHLPILILIFLGIWMEFNLWSFNDGTNDNEHLYGWCYDRFGVFRSIGWLAWKKTYLDAGISNDVIFNETVILLWEWLIHICYSPGFQNCHERSISCYIKFPNVHGLQVRSRIFCIRIYFMSICFVSSTNT